MKGKLFISCIVSLIMTLIISCCLGISQHTEAVEIITHWIPQEEYSLQGSAMGKATKGEILSEEEYNSLAKNKSLAVYNSASRVVWQYDEPGKPPKLILSQAEGEHPFELELKELRKNLRMALNEIDALLNEIDALKNRVKKLEKAQSE